MTQRPPPQSLLRQSSPPPPDYDTTEYFAKMDAMMAKIRDGTINDDDDEPARRKRSVSSAVRGAAEYVKRLGRGHEEPSDKKN